MRVERAFDPKKDFYAKRAFRMQGREYKRGDKFDPKDMTNKTLLKFFQNGFIGYTEDFRDNKTSIKEVSVEEAPVKKEEAVEAPEPEVTEIEEKPKQTSTRRRGRKKSTSSKTEG